MSICAILWRPGYHCLSLQGVWVPFWTPEPLNRTPQDTQIFLCGISKNPNLKLIIEFFHLLIIPMTLFNDIMPYFDELIHVYGWNMWSPLKIWTPKNFTTDNFRHPVSKSCLRHCWLSQMSRIWPQCGITRRQRPTRALVLFTLLGNFHANMRRTWLLGYSPQPACSSS